jgi:hypothetical protein
MLILSFCLRYHVGRHVANLQVTNTYEDKDITAPGFRTTLTPFLMFRTYVRRYSSAMELIFALTNTFLREGYPWPYLRQGDDRDPSFCKLEPN